MTTTPILFTAAGCARCNISKKFLQEKGIAFEEHDALGGGRERFGQFYRTHRSAVVRGAKGIEFPVLADGAAVRQGLAAVVAYLQAGAALDGFIGQNAPVPGWVGGIDLAGGDPSAGSELERLLAFLKGTGLKLRLDTDGRNADLLEHLHGRGIGDRVVMEIKGPPELYTALLGRPVDVSEISRCMQATSRFADRRFETRVGPVADSTGGRRCLTPEEIAAAARWLKEATGSAKQPYFLKRPGTADPPPSTETLLRCRTAARRYQVLTEIAADAD
jgi:pyruvate formate lyase activating enzyme